MQLCVPLYISICLTAILKGGVYLPSAYKFPIVWENEGEEEMKCNRVIVKPSMTNRPSMPVTEKKPNERVKTMEKEQVIEELEKVFTAACNNYNKNRMGSLTEIRELGQCIINAKRDTKRDLEHAARHIDSRVDARIEMRNKLLTKEIVEGIQRCFAESDNAQTQRGS